MAKKSLVDKLRTGLYTGLVAGALSLYGCGGGGGSSRDSPPPIAHNPMVDLSGVNIDLIVQPGGNCFLERELPNPTDEDPGDNPVFYNSAVSSKEGIDTILGPYDEGNNTTLLTIESFDCASNLGPYQIELKYGSVSGGEGTSILEGNSSEALRQIAFWRNIDGNEDIYTGDLINNQLINIQRLTTDPGQDLEPAWSPDGSKIAFTSNRDGNIRLYTMDVDGTNPPTVLTQNMGQAMHPDWSPDGSDIAFSYIDHNSGSNGIATINPDGTNLVKLVEEPGGFTLPSGLSWSPDGSRIFYSASVNGNWEIFSVNSDGTGLPERITNSPYDEHVSDVSPLGDRLAFISDQFGSLDIFSANLDGTSIERITTDPGVEVDPRFSLDGTQIIFAYDTPLLFNPQLYTLDLNGTGEWTQLTSVEGDEGSNRYPAWKPN